MLYAEVTLGFKFYCTIEGIRTIPEFTGPRTGEGLYPGEVFEVVYRFNVYDSDETDEATGM